MSEEKFEGGYQENKIPWWVHLLWTAFLIWAIWYLVKSHA
jgi:hypothetical protein